MKRMIAILAVLPAIVQAEDSRSARLRFIEGVQSQANTFPGLTFRPGNDRDVQTLVLDVDPKRLGYAAGYADDPANRAQLDGEIIASKMQRAVCTVGFATVHINWGSESSWDFRLDCENEKPTVAQGADEMGKPNQKYVGEQAKILRDYPLEFTVMAASILNGRTNPGPCFMQLADVSNNNVVYFVGNMTGILPCRIFSTGTTLRGKVRTSWGMRSITLRGGDGKTHTYAIQQESR
ncbi:MAG: hypothetical protein LAP38_21975 [Acidobacteriia bacterium]|nr:hypothetical protein [Terriglobia bacterium]